jgi:hypothetical protein
MSLTESDAASLDESLGLDKPFILPGHINIPVYQSTITVIETGSVVKEVPARDMDGRAGVLPDKGSIYVATS